ncbi:hydantoinase B/oxoprolinase family protein [Roseomonas sp. HJA6]|uniref:Hydantoinase B/oxoprolinase family protein n=1 Tax=Roseomonas alba TaxID=2846776 RepID=A0ABS7ADF6_9PROT|nr:hydantoinase B/oxoprolinase family protein [Neoroseomonas alba]MBW6399335.1 hydantoinase B/oxoprolinase family protein [Neoroseomonas alba]
MARSLDPILTKILWNRLISIVDEAATGLVRTSYSIVVRDYHDYCVGIFDARGNMLAHSTKTAPGFIAMMPNAMRHFMQVYPVETLREGDVIATNDPWIATGHLLDLTVAAPIFLDGTLVGFTVCVVHHLDIGGRMASIESRDMYEEGLKIPILKLYEAGQPNETLLSVIRANVRMSPKVLGDINAQMAANSIVIAGVRKMIREYDFADLEALADTITRLAGQSMRARLRALPNGIYRNEVRLPPVGALTEPMVIRVAVEIADESVIVDYEGSSPEVEAAVNCTLPFATSYTAYGIKVMVDPTVPNNAGCLEPITVRAPRGSIISCNPPAPTWGRTVIAHNLPEALFGALAPAMPGQVIAACGSTPLVAMYFNGRKHDGEEFLSIISHCGGFGASADRDGYGTLCFPYNTAAIPVEVTEADTCLVYQRKEFAADTAGPGRHRGGVGQEVVFRVADGSHAPPSPVASTLRGSPRNPNSTYPAFGRDGGGAGRGATLTLNGNPVPQGGRQQLRPGDEVCLLLPGGGGHGDPLTRDADAVRADVLAGLVTRAGAQADYGVLLEGAEATIDHAATSILRRSRSESLQTAAN